MSDPASGDVARRIIDWQAKHGRHDLPWQGTRDPYRIWLSEIMLQQTRVNSVIVYYQRFLTRFPDVVALAAADAESVLECWAGLGYYARARNLHQCARRIVAEHGGAFPRSPQALAGLPGIGRSTAAAIAAFAFGARAPILDGNVKRVFCRYFGIEGFPGASAIERQLWEIAGALLPRHGIEAYTQGLMDLGATVCVPRRPACTACPLAGDCVAAVSSRQHELPTTRPGRPRPERSRCFLLLDDGCGFLLEARPPAGIWGGLLVPPELAEGELPEIAMLRLGCRVRSITELAEVRHEFTHFRLLLRPLLVRIEPEQCVRDAAGLVPVAYDDLAAARLPAPFRRILGALVGVSG